MTTRQVQPFIGEVAEESILTDEGLGPKKRKKRRSGSEGGSRGETVTGWLFVTPFLIIFTLFSLIPAILALTTSLTDMTARDLRDPFNVNPVGFQNFIDIFGDAAFRRSLLNTFLFVIITVPITIGVGLFLAVLLNNGIRKLKAVFRAAVYIPVITNIVAAAVIWSYAFSITGPVNELLAGMGLSTHNWTGSQNWAFGLIVVMGVWRTTGTCMILFLAGLQAVPEELNEAAALDGASAWQTFRKVTLPILRPTTLLVTVLMSVMFLNIFEEPYLLTKGGPVGSTRPAALWVFEQFGFGNISYSMAGSVVMLILVAIVAAIQFRMLRPADED